MTAPKRPASQLLTIPETAERLGDVSDNHVYRLIASGALNAVDISQPGARKSKTRVREDDLQAFIAARTRSAKRLRVAT